MSNTSVTVQSQYIDYFIIAFFFHFKRTHCEYFCNQRRLSYFHTHSIGHILLPMTYCMPWMHWSPRATDIILEHPLYVTNTTIAWDTTNIWASARENLSSRGCEQQRRRPACASAQTDQRLCYSLFGNYHV